MKNPNTKLIVGLALLTSGLVLVSVGIRWLFFLGLAFVVLSGVFSFRYRTRSGSIVVWLFYIAAITFLVLFSSDGVEAPPRAALVAVWLSGIVEEFYGWRLIRGTT